MRSDEYSSSSSMIDGRGVCSGRRIIGVVLGSLFSGIQPGAGSMSKSLCAVRGSEVDSFILNAMLIVYFAAGNGPNENSKRSRPVG